jgi:hypothetical protein
MLIHFIRDLNDELLKHPYDDDLLRLTPLTLFVLGALGVGELSLAHFVYFKATFAAVEGALVTPFLALSAISEASAGFAAVSQPA